MNPCNLARQVVTSHGTLKQNKVFERLRVVQSKKHLCAGECPVWNFRCTCKNKKYDLTYLTPIGRTVPANIERSEQNDQSSQSKSKPFWPSYSWVAHTWSLGPSWHHRSFEFHRAPPVQNPDRWKIQEQWPLKQGKRIPTNLRNKKNPTKPFLDPKQFEELCVSPAGFVTIHASTHICIHAALAKPPKLFSFHRHLLVQTQHTSRSSCIHSACAHTFRNGN